MKNIISVNPKFIKNALRNCGYSNYTALTDIIDNSFETEVSAKNVQISFDFTNGRNSEIKKIYVSDDGCGMSFDTLKEALSLGSESGKSEETLGKFGTGLKTASLSIGTRLTVYTKTKEDNHLLVGILDLGNVDDSKPVYVDIRRVSKNNSVYKLFCEKVSFGKSDVSNGTVVEISKIDRLTCKTNNFVLFENISKECGITFNKILGENSVKLFVNDKIVEPFLVIPSNAELLKDGWIHYKKKTMHDIYYRAYYIPKDINGELDTESTLGRGITNQGLWIYRNNRLVGRHLTLGIFKNKHPHRNGLRIEIFVKGDCDYLFGSTFTKTIQEKNKGEIDSGLFNELLNVISPIDKQVTDKDRNEEDYENIRNGKNNDVYAEVKKMQNNNALLNVPKCQPVGSNHVVKNPRGPQKNPNPHKNFDLNGWIGEIKEEKQGIGSLPYFYEVVNNKTIITVNVDHPIYTEIFSKVSKDIQVKLAALATCDELARKEVGYYNGDSDVRFIIDEYDEARSSNSRKTLYNRFYNNSRKTTNKKDK